MLQPALQTSPELDAGLAQLTVRLGSWVCGATLLATFPGRVMSGQVIARAGVPSAALKLATPPDEFSLLLVQAMPLKPAASYHFQLVVEPAQASTEAVVDPAPHPAGETTDHLLIEAELMRPSVGIGFGAASAVGLVLLGACWAARRWRLRAGHHLLSGEDDGLFEEEEYPQLVPDALSTFDDEIASVAPSLVLRDLAERSARRKVID